MSELTDNDIERVMTRFDSASDDVKAVAMELKRRIEQAPQKADRCVDYWKGKYHQTCESEEDYKQRAEAAEADATRLRGALRRLYRANSLKAPDNELADAMAQARDAVVCDQTEPQGEPEDGAEKRGEPDTAEGRLDLIAHGHLVGVLLTALNECVIGNTTQYYLADTLKEHELNRIAAHVASKLSAAGYAQPAEQGTDVVYVPTDKEIERVAGKISNIHRAEGFREGYQWVIRRLAALNANGRIDKRATGNEDEND